MRNGKHVVRNVRFVLSTLLFHILTSYDVNHSLSELIPDIYARLRGQWSHFQFKYWNRSTTHPHTVAVTTMQCPKHNWVIEMVCIFNSEPWTVDEKRYKMKTIKFKLRFWRVREVETLSYRTRRKQTNCPISNKRRNESIVVNKNGKEREERINCFTQEIQYGRCQWVDST